MTCDPELLCKFDDFLGLRGKAVAFVQTIESISTPMGRYSAELNLAPLGLDSTIQICLKSLWWRWNYTAIQKFSVAMLHHGIENPVMFAHRIAQNMATEAIHKCISEPTERKDAMADYSQFEWHLFSDVEIIILKHESAQLGDHEFEQACLKELNRRVKDGEICKTRR